MHASYVFGWPKNRRIFEKKRFHHTFTIIGFGVCDFRGWVSLNIFQKSMGDNFSADFICKEVKNKHKSHPTIAKPAKI